MNNNSRGIIEKLRLCKSYLIPQSLYEAIEERLYVVCCSPHPESATVKQLEKMLEDFITHKDGVNALNRVSNTLLSHEEKKSLLSNNELVSLIGNTDSHRKLYLMNQMGIPCHQTKIAMDIQEVIDFGSMPLDTALILDESLYFSCKPVIEHNEWAIQEL